MTTSGLEDPARRVYDQMRALYSAVRAGDAQALKDVLAAEEGEGPDLNHTSPALLGEFDQCCLLALAIMCFGKPAEVNDSRALSAAASKRQRAGVLRELLKHKLRFRREDGLRRPEQRLTVLHLVSHAGFTEDERDILRVIVRAALAEGVELGAQDAKGQTPLDLAVLEDQPLVLRELLSAGAPVRVRDGNRAALYAQQCDRLQCLVILRDKGFAPQAAGQPAAASAAGQAAALASPRSPAGSRPASATAFTGRESASSAGPVAGQQPQLAAAVGRLHLGGSGGAADGPGRGHSSCRDAAAVAAGAESAPGSGSGPAQTPPAGTFQALTALLGRCMAAGALDAVSLGKFLLQSKAEGPAAQQQTLEVLGVVEAGGGVAAVGEVVRQELARAGGSGGGH